MFSAEKVRHASKWWWLSGPDFRDTISQKLTPRVVTSPKIIVTGGHILVTDYQAITRIGYKTIKV
jgi:hypothetical protein